MCNASNRPSTFGYNISQVETTEEMFINTQQCEAIEVQPTLVGISVAVPNEMQHIYRYK